MSTASAQHAVRVDRDGMVAIFTLNRPEAINAINTAMREELTAGLREAAADDDVRAIVIRGEGARGFCAGADISEFVPPDSLLKVRDAKQPPLWIDVLAESPKPTIAAIHGYCLGGGLELALACDVRIASDDAQFALPEVTLGIIPGAGGTQRLPRVIGVGPALELILTGRRIRAERALALGLVAEVVPSDELFGAAFELASQIAKAGPRAVSAAKEAVRRGVELSLADGLRLEADLSTLLYGTEDRIEGAAAFKERRPAQFRGR